jgi:hypothetical protein
MIDVGSELMIKFLTSGLPHRPQLLLICEDADRRDLPLEIEPEVPIVDNLGHRLPNLEAIKRVPLAKNASIITRRKFS